MTSLVNRVIFKSTKNNGLGTSIDIQGNIDISGNIIPSSNGFDLGSNTQRWKDMHFSGTLFQNGSSYIGSQWTTSGNKLFYTAGNVGIGTNNPINTLDVSGNSRISGNIAVGGNLSVSGTFTTIDSTTVTVQDPIITLSQSVLTNNDGKDRGVEFLYYDGSSKRGFFGFDNTSSNFIYLVNATNSNEILSGTYGNIQGGAFISSNTSGAPLTISSSALVTNLNADLLDNQDGTYYRNMNNVASGTLTVNYGGTGTNSLSSGKLLVGAGTSAVLTPTDLTWNGSNLGIGSSNPSQKLDIIGSVKATSFFGSGASLQSIYQASRIFNVSTPIFNYNIQDISGDNPTIQVTSGHTYAFSLNVPSHPFNIRTIANQSGSNITIGMTHVALDGTITTGSNANNKTDGTIFWTIPYNIIPVGNSNVTVYYQCGVHNSMIGSINIYASNSSQWTDGSSNKIYYNSGNVGIGSANPIHKLDVSGNINFTGDLYKNSLLYVGSQWTTSGNTIYYNGGNVGIGKTPTLATLDISGNIRVDNIYSLGKNNYISFFWDTYTDLSNNVTASLHNGMLGYAYDTGRFYYAHDASWNQISTLMDFENGSLLKWTTGINNSIYYNNSVGIGTILPQYSLDVKGSFNVSGIISQTNDNCISYRMIYGDKSMSNGTGKYISFIVSWTNIVTDDKKTFRLGGVCHLISSDTQYLYNKFESLITPNNDISNNKPKLLVTTDFNTLVTSNFTNVVLIGTRISATSINFKIQWDTTETLYIGSLQIEIVASSTLGNFTLIGNNN